MAAFAMTVIILKYTFMAIGAIALLHSRNLKTPIKLNLMSLLLKECISLFPMSIF
jgi:hypothetical protein